MSDRTTRCFACGDLIDAGEFYCNDCIKSRGASLHLSTGDRRKQGEHSDEERVKDHNSGDSDDMSGPVGQKA